MVGASSDPQPTPGDPPGRTPLKILYISASGRSGSTIVGNILGELDGFFHAGELRTLWKQGLVGGRLCGCGQPVRGCEFWHAVLAQTLSVEGAPPLDPSAIRRLHEETIRIRNMPRILRSSRTPGVRIEPLRRYSAVAERLYVAISEVSGSHVIVDSSKAPADAALILSIPSVEPYFLHLVRDPRAVAHSWRRQKSSPGSRRDTMMRLSASTSTRNWMLVNAATEVLRRYQSSTRYMLVRYETFVDRPQATIEQVLQLLGEERQHLPFVDRHRVQLTPSHTAGGNPDRFRTGPIALREDAEWLASQSRRDRVVSTLISMPLLRRYGYPIFPRVAH